MEPILDLHTRRVFEEALGALNHDGVPFVIAGAFALNYHTGIWRDTKDIDVFCRPQDAKTVLDTLARAGFMTYVEENHWLGKAIKDQALVDVLWGGGNWATFIDQGWFDHAKPGRIVGQEVLVAAPEDIILSKSYVAGRERFDGTDIVHLIRACGRGFDWPALAERFAGHWPLLLHYAVLFRFVYPDQRDIIPASFIHELALRVGTESEVADGLSFRGPLLDRYGYLHDMEADGRPDPREAMAQRAGLPVADVVRRRRLDREALLSGKVYRQDRENKGEPSPWPFDATEDRSG